MTLGRALEGNRPDVVTVPMLSWLLDGAAPDRLGGLMGAGLRLKPEGGHTLVVATGTLRGITTCLALWPRRGVSVLVADADYSHAQLCKSAMLRWRRKIRRVRTWWLDAQPVDEVRSGDRVELLLRESAWPFPYFSGHARPAGPDASGAVEVLAGIDWQHRPATLIRAPSILTGPHAALTADIGDSAFREVP